MHLYIITRGLKQYAEQFITELQGKYVPFRIFDKEKPGPGRKITDGYHQISVRPVQLYEIVFPESQRDLVYNTILGPERGQGTYTGIGGGKMTQHKWHDKIIWGIRKILGIRKLKPWDPAKKTLPISKFHTEIIPLGEKEDYWVDAEGKQHHNPTEEEKLNMEEGL